MAEEKHIVIDGIHGIWVPELEEALPDGYVSEHFREAEFDCNHCGQFGASVSDELLQVLEQLREHFGGQPVTINSGVRCEQHNRNVGGATSSRHLMKFADAADIVVKNVAPRKVAGYLDTSYRARYGIGRYDTFTHIDTRPGSAARWEG